MITTMTTMFNIVGTAVNATHYTGRPVDATSEVSILPTVLSTTVDIPIIDADTNPNPDRWFLFGMDLAFDLNIDPNQIIGVVTIVDNGRPTESSLLQVVSWRNNVIYRDVYVLCTCIQDVMHMAGQWNSQAAVKVQSENGNFQDSVIRLSLL